MEETCGIMARRMVKLQCDLRQKNRVIKKKESSKIYSGIFRSQSNFFTSQSTGERGITQDWNIHTT